MVEPFPQVLAPKDPDSRHFKLMQSKDLTKVFAVAKRFVDSRHCTAYCWNVGQCTI